MSERCRQCGNQCPPDWELCLECAADNADTEARVNEYLDEREL